VDTFGYGAFFTGTAMLGLPVLVLVWLTARSHAGAAPRKASG
jgi:PAT family beta-lactamase induction signal transducer AmpG